MKKILLKTYILGIFSSIILLPILVYAQTKYSQDLFGLFEYLLDIINDIVIWLITTGAVIFFIAYLAWQVWKISQGKKVQGTGWVILYGLIALTVMFTFYAVSSLIAVTFGIQIGIPQFFGGQDGLSPGSGQIPNTRSIIDY